MTAAAWATDLTDIYTTGAGNFTALGGGAGGLNTETDYFIIDSGCKSKNAWTNARKGLIHDNGSGVTVPTDGCITVWGYYSAINALDTKANGGIIVVLGSGSGDYSHYYVGGSDVSIFDTWVPYVVDPDVATADGTDAGTPDGTDRWMGLMADLPTTSGPTKGAPIGVSGIRYGRHQIDYTAGDVTPNGPNTFALAEAYANATTRRWGNIEFIKGTYFIQGFHSFGVSGTAVDFRDSDKVIFWRDSAGNNETDDAVTANYNRIEVINASSNVDWTNIIFKALGTGARGDLVVTSGAFDAVACQFIGMRNFTFLDASSATDCIFDGCNTITAPGTDLSGSQVLLSTVATDTGAVVWNVAQDPDGELDDMTFEKGTNAHHAIEFGTSAPLTMTLQGITFTGFVNTIGDNAAPLLFPDTGGDVTWAISAVGTSGLTADGYKKARAGDTVTITIDPRTLTVEVRDDAGTLITDATEITVVRNSDDVTLFNVESETSGSADYSYTYTTDTVVYINVLTVAGLYSPKTAEPVTLIDADQTVVVQLANDRAFSNP